MAGYRINAAASPDTVLQNSTASSMERKLGAFAMNHDPKLGTCAECKDPHEREPRCKNWAPEDQPRPTPPLTTYQHIDRMARETALLAMELARFCLKSHALQTSERELAVRIRDLCYTLLGTKHHKALPDANIEAEFPTTEAQGEASQLCEHGKLLIGPCESCGREPLDIDGDWLVSQRTGRVESGAHPSQDASDGIYVASRASIPARSEMWRKLRHGGIKINATWIDEAEENATQSFSELWSRIEREIRSSAGLVLYAESDDFPLKGALVEVGMALAMGIKVVVVAPGVQMNARNFKPFGSWAKHPLVTFEESLGIACRQAGARSTPSLDPEKAFTLRCRCGSDFKPECPDCGTLYAETYPSGSTPSPDPPTNLSEQLETMRLSKELFKAKFESAQIEVERLREALREFGQHKSGCLSRPTCYCGWEEFKAALAPSLPTKRE